MSDATLLAGELADISAAVDRLAQSVAGMRPQVNVAPQVAAPAVSVTVPEQAPVVNVSVPAAAAPQVSVAAPVVNLAPSEAVGYTVRITERDQAGRIVSFRMTPS